jgi:hypothetical protein
MAFNRHSIGILGRNREQRQITIDSARCPRVYLIFLDIISMSLLPRLTSLVHQLPASTTPIVMIFALLPQLEAPKYQSLFVPHALAVEPPFGMLQSRWHVPSPLSSTAHNRLE